MRALIICLFGFFVLQSSAFAGDSGIDAWLVDRGGATTQNYYLSIAEKNSRLSHKWKTYKKEKGKVAIDFPWQPDQYAFPSHMLADGTACVNSTWMDKRGKDLTLALAVTRCKGQHGEFESRLRLRGALRGTLKHGRKLIGKHKLTVPHGSGMAVFLKYPSGNMSFGLLISVDGALYLVSVTGSDIDEIEKYSKIFLASFRLNSESWKVDIKGLEH